MATYTLSGVGTQYLTAGTTQLQIVVTTFPGNLKHGTAFPTNYYHLGLIRPGDGGFYQPPIPIEGLDTWMPLPTNTTIIGYSLALGVTASVSEGLPGAPAIAATSPANGATVSHVGLVIAGTSTEVYPTSGTGLHVQVDYGWSTTLGGSTTYVSTYSPATLNSDGTWSAPINEPTFTSHTFWNFIAAIADSASDEITLAAKLGLHLT